MLIFIIIFIFAFDYLYHYQYYYLHLHFQLYLLLFSYELFLSTISFILLFPGSTSGSIYYILGQQNGPPGKLPPGWDLTLRGMVVGEKRKITLPYTLAYDRAGSKDKKIPPFTNVIYTVRLLSLT